MESKGSKNSVNYFLAFNRKIHIYLGLFLLLFIWLFCISGLIINHGEWKFAGFYEQRKERKTDFTFPVSSLNHNPELVRLVFTKLDIAGEVENIKSTSESIDFRVHSPGTVRDIHIDPSSGKGTLKEIKFNFWGKLKTLHTHNGVNKMDLSKTPNWIITKIWRFTMDMIAIILILLCLGSWVMWYRVRQDYQLGYFLLAFGFIVSGYYIFLIA